MSKYTSGNCIQTGCKVGQPGPTGPGGINDRYLTHFSAAINAASSMDYFSVEPGLSYIPGHRVDAISVDGSSSFKGIITDYDITSGIIGIKYILKGDSPPFNYNTTESHELKDDDEMHLLKLQ